MNFCYCRARPANSFVKPSPTTACTVVHKKFDSVATRLLSGVTAAFFASLERCSCINIATIEDVDDDDSFPLILGDIICPAADVSCTAEDDQDHDHHMVEGNKDAPSCEVNAPILTR
ncbi:hypothetical protein ACS0TY_029906 [Phlomoides rotata]